MFALFNSKNKPNKLELDGDETGLKPNAYNKHKVKQLPSEYFKRHMLGRDGSNERSDSESAKGIS